MSRPHRDAHHGVLTRILEEMLDADESISASAVAARHPDLKAASAITRHAERRALVAAYTEKQRALRTWAARTQKTSRAHLATRLAAQEGQIADLHEQVRTLVESHLHLMSLVAEFGGVRRLREYYSQQRPLRARLALSRALPSELEDDAQ